MQRLIEHGIEIEKPATDLLVYDRTHFPGPGVCGERPALVTDFVGEAEAHGPFPFFGDGDARTDVVTDPLNALAAACGSENVEADFEPVGEAVGDLDGFVFGVVGGVEAILNGLGAVDGEIAVEFEHGVVWVDEVGFVDLDFVVVLGADPRCVNGLDCQEEQERERERGAETHNFLKGPSDYLTRESRETSF